MRTSCTMYAVLAFIVLAASATAAPPEQQALQRVKDLYEQAAYEDALDALSNLPSSESTTESGRYRAACLLALGRTEEALGAVRDVVRAHPEYLPDPADTSPRVLELFKAARRTELPGMLRATYADGRTAMDNEDFEAAIQRFELVMRLAGDADLAADSVVPDLKVLAAGFLELTRARIAAAKPADAATPNVSTPDASTSSASTPEEPDGTPAVPAEGQSPTASPAVTPAVPINQQLPPWVAPDSLSRSWEFLGAVRVEIGPDGKVRSATMEKPVHPSYDAQLLAAARGWTYQPASLNGVSVASSLTVRVVLKPR
jgi:TonB family protein